jgi:hypothetical protein
MKSRKHKTEKKKIKKMNSNTNLIGSKQKPGKGRKKKFFLISATSSCSSSVEGELQALPISFSIFPRIYSSRAAIYCCCAVANCPGVLLYLSPPNDSFHEEEAPRNKKGIREKSESGQTTDGAEASGRKKNGNQ